MGILCNQVYALDIVYPKSGTVTINSPKSFFIGSADYEKPLYINGKETEVHPSGGFAQQVNLSYGKNTFEITSGSDRLVYTIIRPKPNYNKNLKSPVATTYKEVKYGEITKNNTPLRSTPVDGGINRIAHLPEGFPLRLCGENNNFYKIDLGTDHYGWVAKSAIKQTQEKVNYVQIIGTEFENDGKYYKYTFHLTGRTPWEITENNGLELKLYNIIDANNHTYETLYSKDKLLAGKKLIILLGE